MINRVIVACLCTLTLTTSAFAVLPPQPPMQALAAGFWRLGADDEFTNSSLIGKLWFTDSVYSPTLNLPAPPVGYTIAGGVLTINTDTSGFGYGLATVAPGHFANDLQFGYIEARMRFNPISGGKTDWPSFWMTSIEGIQGAKVFSEIDIMEMYPCKGINVAGCYQTTIHEWTNGFNAGKQNANDQPAQLPSINFNQFHTYGLLWTPRKVQWFFDDQLVTSVPIGPGTDYPSAATNHMAVILGTASANQPLLVDWVRIWQQ